MTCFKSFSAGSGKNIEKLVDDSWSFVREDGNYQIYQRNNERMLYDTKKQQVVGFYDATKISKKGFSKHIFGQNK